MKKIYSLLFSFVFLHSAFSQSKCDSFFVNGNLYLQRDVSKELNIVASHIDKDVQPHHHEQWAYYLSKPHPSASTINTYFNDAAAEFRVPVEILKTIGQIENNWTQIGPSIDKGWGIMHLVQNNYCNTLHEAALLLGVSDTLVKEDAQQNIRGAAALLRKYFDDGNMHFSAQRIEDWYSAVKKFSGLISDELQTIQADRYFGVIKDGIHSTTLWNEEIVLPRNSAIDISYITAHYNSDPQPQNVDRSSDYGPAIANLTTCNYSSGRNHSIDTWVNHWIGTGTAAGAVSWFQNCSADASAHFVTANNGTIYQVVAVANTAWHCGASGYPYNNGRSIGEEHEATNANPGLWNSTAMLQASANMACYFCGLYGIATNQNHVSPGICGHQNMPGTNTDCPGTIPWTTWFGYFNNGTCSAMAVTPPNDYCGNAVALTVYGQTCTASTNGYINGATQSTAPIACGGYTSTTANDVWFTFVATATAHDITVAPSSGLDAVIDLRTACPGASINCADIGGGEGTTEILQATGLTIGSNYYVRVYDYTGASNPPTTTSFTICVTTPCSPPVKPVIVGSHSICSGQATVLSVSNACSGCNLSWSNGSSGSQATVTNGGNYLVTASNACGTVASDPFTFTVNQTPQPVISNLSNAYCLASSNATLSATPSGGIFSGNGILGNIFSPSNAGTGTHTITYTVAQSGCTGSISQTVSVSANPAVHISTNGATSFCNGSNVVLTATQGVSYLWSNAATSQSITISQGGVFDVTVTNPGGCNANVSADNPTTVTVFPNPVAYAGADQTLINVPNNIVTIGSSPTASGGTTPYTYIWSPVAGLSSATNANPVAANISVSTNYFLTVTDVNGCSATDEISITLTPACNYHLSSSYVLVNAIGGIDSFYVDVSDSSCAAWDITGCNGITIISPSLPHSGDAMVVFSVSSNTNTSQRVCSMTVTGGENFVIVQDGATVIDPCNPPPQTPTVQLNSCELAASYIPNLSYQWYMDSAVISSANSRFYTVNQSGYYYVVVADSNFCTAQSQDVFVNYPACMPTGVQERGEIFSFEIYESIDDQWQLIVGKESIGNYLEIFNAVGQLVVKTEVKNQHSEIDARTFSTGIYFVRLSDRSEQVLVKKISKF